MTRYTKLIVLSVVLLVVIALITLVMIYDVDLMLFKNLSIAGIQEKKMSVETLMAKQIIEETNNRTAKEDLKTSKDAFDVAKEIYENIDESTISVIQEATKEEKYFIEYLWIVLGNYATANGVKINILTPGSTNETADNSNNSQMGEDEEDSGITSDPLSGSMSSGLQDGIKITIDGRYANVADFVFDVENDKSLRFKLDNIGMTYLGNNDIRATFDVLSLAVLK